MPPTYDPFTKIAYPPVLIGLRVKFPKLVTRSPEEPANSVDPSDATPPLVGLNVKVPAFVVRLPAAPATRVEPSAEMPAELIGAPEGGSAGGAELMGVVGLGGSEA